MSTAFSSILSEFESEESARSYDRLFAPSSKRVLMTLRLPFSHAQAMPEVSRKVEERRGAARPGPPLHRSPVRLGKLNRPSFCNAALDDSHRTVDYIARIVVMQPSHLSKLTPMFRQSQIIRTFSRAAECRIL
ncbi:hypothetical protein [Achromobacter sp. JUb104]|uniref:hypothetical protein n=1 Tax=Achromobacter sp. JUb104 TaxID=2940590 RepID=UPI002169CD9C|nr:hypothetical protein [Achromobacter sp. JUb104]MCS3507496.1 hypothetical protein [Achromobacter sp. JUb104]